MSRPIYVNDRGDLYEFIFNEKGELVQVLCAPNGTASGRFEIPYEEVPEEVIMAYENQLIDRLSDRRYTPRDERSSNELNESEV